MKKVKRYLFDDGYKILRERLLRETPKYRERSKAQIVSYYQGVDEKGQIRFITPSGTTPGVFWSQIVVLVDLPKLIKKYVSYPQYSRNMKKKAAYKNVKLSYDPVQSRTDKAIVQEAMAGDVKVYCNDPSFLYWGFKYISYLKGYGLRKESRAPLIRNPQMKGSVCKHLDSVLKVLPFHIGEVTRDLKKKGFL